MQRYRHSVVIPYVQGTSETIHRILLSYRIGSHYKPQNLIRHRLVKPKDKTDLLEASGSVYYICCKDCDAAYVGESQRPLKTRIAEHKRPSNKSSPVALHSTTENHSMDWDHLQVLDREQDYFILGMKEAINIQRSPCSLNRDKGRYELDDVYRSVTCPPSTKGKSADLDPQVS